MKIHKQYKNKFVTATTRRANHNDNIFAKITFWPSKLDYENGNCRDVISYSNLLLSNGMSKNIGKLLDTKIQTLITYLITATSLPEGRQGKTKGEENEKKIIGRE